MTAEPNEDPTHTLERQIMFYLRRLREARLAMPQDTGKMVSYETTIRKLGGDYIKLTGKGFQLEPQEWRYYMVEK